MSTPYLSFIVYVLRKGDTDVEHACFLTHQSAYDCAHSITRQDIVWLELIGLHRTEGAVRLMFYRSADCED